MESLRRPTAELALVLGEGPRTIDALVEQLSQMDLEERRDDELREVDSDSELGQALDGVELDDPEELRKQLTEVVLRFSEPSGPRTPTPAPKLTSLADFDAVAGTHGREAAKA